MDTNETLRAHISAMVDGELPQADAELALAALQEEDGKQAWDRYHLIRDTLRAMPAPDLSPGFAERLATALAHEQGRLPSDRGDRGDLADGNGRGSGGANAATGSTGQAAILANPGAS
jgi:sigma-E factor negative regulatory protein RseA